MALELDGFMPVILRFLRVEGVRGSGLLRTIAPWAQGCVISVGYGLLVLTRAESSIFCSKSARAELYFSTDRRRLSAAFLVLVSA